MRTVFLIGRWELLLLARSGVAWLAVAAALLLSSVAIWNGHARFTRERAAVSDFVHSDESRLGVYQRRAAMMERQGATGADGPIPKYEFAWGPKKPLWPTAWAPLSAVLPPHGLQRLNKRESDLQRTAFTGWTRWASAETTDSPLALLAGPFDLSFLVLALFPLLAIALTWDLISGEVESGMIGSLLCHPVSLRQLVVGKMLARVGILIGCWALAMGFAFVVAGTHSTDAAMRFFGYAGSALLYTAIWLLLCVTVNLSIHRSGATLVALAFLWLLLTYAGPAALDRASRALHPSPSRIDYVNRKREIEQDSTRLDEAIALRSFFERHRSLAPLEQYTGDGRRFLVNYARREEREKLAEELEALYELPDDRRQTLVRWFTLASPRGRGCLW